jgi:hypothetical protein
MEDLRCFTVHYFYEIKDAEIYGGKGSTGCAEMKYDMAVNMESLSAEACAKASIANIHILSKQLNVPVENITAIHRDKYLEMTKEDEDCDSSFDDYEKD